MIIECTSCGARAKLPDSKEGAKVRCAQCDHIYVARPPGARRRAGATKSDPTKYFLIGGGALVFGIIMVIFNRGGSEAGPAAPIAEAEVEAPSAPATGWDSPHVVFARNMHELAFGANTSKMFVLIDFQRVHDARLEGEGADGADPTWVALDNAAQTEFRNLIVAELTSGEGEVAPAAWKPYDGDLISETDDSAVVHLQLQSRDAAAQLEDRWIEWELIRGSDQRWRASRWERWISPEEEKRERARRVKKTTKRTLSDGSQVIEGVVRTEGIEYHADTPRELVSEIEGLIDQLIDIESRPKDITAARERLTEIGKHAVPGLIKRMGSMPLDKTEENAIQLNLIHMLLSDITRYNTTFTVHVAMGGTEERMDSGIKQWFGWYDRKWKRFWKTADSYEEEFDPFWDAPDRKPRNENERRRMEELRKKREGGG